LAIADRWVKTSAERFAGLRSFGKIAEHHGRVVKTTGDGIVIEYPAL